MMTIINRIAIGIGFVLTSVTAQSAMPTSYYEQLSNPEGTDAYWYVAGAGATLFYRMSGEQFCPPDDFVADEEYWNALLRDQIAYKRQRNETPAKLIEFVLDKAMRRQFPCD